MKKFDATGLPHASFEALYPTVFRAGSPDVDLGSPFLKCVASIWAFPEGGGVKDCSIFWGTFFPRCRGMQGLARMVWGTFFSTFACLTEGGVI